MWDLGLVLFDSHRDVVFGKTLVLAIFWVFGGKLGPKMDQNLQFWYVPFLLKDSFFFTLQFVFIYNDKPKNINSAVIYKHSSAS